MWKSQSAAQLSEGALARRQGLGASPGRSGRASRSLSRWHSFFTTVAQCAATQPAMASFAFAV
jgi:hypothetical protein